MTKVLAIVMILLASPAQAADLVPLADLVNDPKHYQLHVVTTQGTVKSVEKAKRETLADPCQGAYSFVLADGSATLEISVLGRYTTCKRAALPEDEPTVKPGDHVRVHLRLYAPGMYRESMQLHFAENEQTRAIAISITPLP